MNQKNLPEKYILVSISRVQRLKSSLRNQNEIPLAGAWS